MAAGHRDALVALLAEFESPNVRAIPPAKYGEFARAACARLAELGEG